MTQALNLANFANNLNTAGATSNSGLQNSSVTVTAGTGMSGGGAVALGSSVTLTNAGVTSVAAGTGISVSASTGGVTITNTQTPSTGTVTSVATGNGLSGGTITTSGTLTVACPSAGSVGSYGFFQQANQSGDTTFGNTASGSLLIPASLINGSCGGVAVVSTQSGTQSGTWRCMGTSTTNGQARPILTVWCRVS